MLNLAKNISATLKIQQHSFHDLVMRLNVTSKRDKVVKNTTLQLSRLRTLRTNFPSRDAGTSVTQRLFTLPNETLVYPTHNYQGYTVSTIREEKQWYPSFAGRNRDKFIQFLCS